MEKASCTPDVMARSGRCNAFASHIQTSRPWSVVGITGMLVTTVSVVQRWNQAVAVRYKAASPAIAAKAKQTNISASVETKRSSTRNATATIHAAIAGKKNIQCSLVEYSTLSPGCRISSI